MKTKKKLLETLGLWDTSNGERRGTARREFPGPVAGHRLRFPPRVALRIEARFGEALPRAFEWTVVPGPDGLQ